MTITKDSFKKVHLGGKLEEYSEISWSEETKQKNLELIVAQTKDAVKTYISPEYLGRVVSHLEENGTKKLEHPMDAIKNVSREFAFSEEKEKRILDYFISGADSTPFGIAQAVTFYAHKDANADEQYELEKVSVAIIENAKTFDKPMVERRKKTDSKSFLLN
jgi:hypothetical protein